MSRTTKLLVELTPALSERLNAYCDRLGASKGGVIRVALEAYLGQVEEEESEHFVVKLGPGCGKTFSAFRQVLLFPSKNKLIEAALAAYIERQCDEIPHLREQIENVKHEQARQRMYSINDGRREGESGG